MTKDSLQAEKGEDWKTAAQLAASPYPLLRAYGERWLEAMHDRDRFQRERDYEREQRT